MSEAIICAIVAAIASMFGSWLSFRKQARDQREADAEREKARAIAEAERDTKLEMRLESVEKKLDEHNGYAKRFEEIGKAIVEIKTILNQKGA